MQHEVFLKDSTIERASHEKNEVQKLLQNKKLFYKSVVVHLEDDHSNQRNIVETNQSLFRKKNDGMEQRLK
jgi:hypothetical protein